MPSPDLPLRLAKLLIALAWADGELQTEEINALKDLLFRLPRLAGRDWEALEMYMDAPVGEAERERLLQSVLEATRTAEDRQLVLESLREVARADGVLGPEEEAALEESVQTVAAAPTGLLGAVRRLLGGALQRRRQAAAPNRDARLDDYARNAVYFALQSHQEAGAPPIDRPEPVVRKLCLAAALLARVAATDEELSDAEREAIRAVLQRRWGLDEEEAALVADLAATRALRGLDRPRLLRSFFEATTHEERRDFLTALFAVAEACGATDFEELEEIRGMAQALKLSHADFIAAKTARG